MEHFTPFQSLLGGMLIGLSAAGMWLLKGQVAGISGIASSILPGSPLWKKEGRQKGELSWRLAFVAGLVAAGSVTSVLFPARFEGSGRSLAALVVAGLLVGVGTRLGSGCTSGHGVCGLARLSPRSMAATCTFMGVGFVTVYVVNHLLGGL